MTHVAASHEIRCHWCHHWIGESSRPMTFVRVFRHPRLRESVPGPRDAWRCKACGSVSVFSATDSAEVGWNRIEVKR